MLYTDFIAADPQKKPNSSHQCLGFYGATSFKQTWIKILFFDASSPVDIYSNVIGISRFVVEPITHIPRSYFYQCQKLSTIMFTNNKLSEMPNVEFIADLLQQIELVWNKIVHAAPFYGRKYPHLTDMLFDYNNLVKFCMPLQ